jgi:hypothetical protein
MTDANENRYSIIVTHAWDSARESYTAYLKHLLPAYEVRAVLLEDLEEILTATPDAIVVCGSMIDLISKRARGWVVLSDTSPHDAIVGTRLHSRVLPTPTFDEVVSGLLELIDGLASDDVSAAARL